MDIQWVNESCGVEEAVPGAGSAVPCNEALYSHLRAEPAPKASNWRLSCSGQPRVASLLQS